MLLVGKIKDPCHNQSVNGRLHYKNIWYDEIGKRKNLMYSDCGKHCALGKQIILNCYDRKYYTYDGGSEVSIYTKYLLSLDFDQTNSLYPDNDFCQMSRPNQFFESFADMQKIEMTQNNCSFCLELKTQNYSWRLHMRVTNLHVSILSKCLLPIFLCGYIGRDDHTNMSCKYFSRLHHIIVVFCQVLLSSTRNLDFLA